MNIKVKKLNQLAKIPTKATKGSAGFDLYACLENEIILKPQKLVIIPTGISIQLESEEFVALIYGRSGLGIKHGITLSNSVGVIDSDYRGEICVGLCNISDKEYTINPNDRIAQMVIQKVENVAIEVVENLDNTQRGTGGFGSSGK